MNRLSIEPDASARNNAALILKAMNCGNQSKVASQLGVDASTLSRMKSDKKTNNMTEIDFIGALLSAFDLKVVKEDDVYCSPEIAEATRVYLSNAFSSPEYMRILFK